SPVVTSLLARNALGRALRRPLHPGLPPQSARVGAIVGTQIRRIPARLPGGRAVLESAVGPAGGQACALQGDVADTPCRRFGARPPLRRIRPLSDREDEGRQKPPHSCVLPASSSHFFSSVS